MNSGRKIAHEEALDAVQRACIYKVSFGVELSQLTLVRKRFLAGWPEEHH